MVAAADGAAEAETQRLLRDSIAGFVQRTGDLARIRAWRDRTPGFDRAVWREMGEAGWLGIAVPEEAGGLGLGHGALAAAAEALGRGIAPEPFVASAVLCGALLAAGDPAGPARALLARLIAGELAPAAAWQEAGDGDADRLPEARAEAAGFGVRLIGAKRAVPGAGDADGFVVTACDDHGHTGLYWVERDAAGLEVRTARAVDGGTIGTLELAATPAAPLAQGPAVAAALGDAIETARLAQAAEMLGVMGRALDMTVAYVKQRVQFGRPIGAFQALQHRLVDAWTQQQLADAAVAEAARVLDTEADPVRRAAAVSGAQARAAQAGLLITREAIQMHGGIGYTDEYDAGLCLKRMLVLSAWLGNAGWHRRRYARLAGGADG